MTRYYILPDGTTEKKTENCLMNLAFIVITLIAIGVAIGRKTTQGKEK